MPFPIELKYIVQTEEELGVLFPDQFKTKMMQENGGELTTKEDDWQVYPFFDRSDKKRISRTCNHIGLETKQARSWRNFPTNAIAIASNGSGDYLILLPETGNEKQLGEVIYSWWHEEGIPQQIADSINDLLNQ
ncbi:SMI1/KNR4 family protein [Myroides marinus]|uniref:SMI1/KNR4 family protein n=1 Tax=Myroides marinus TaxID=703342 RepID=UPI002577703A|nr:SMI1/KNR4 family protein [Myroides marinus]MDM1347885.1 SMI1/KNR4 family protein [Myroides marinus]MDM1355876.1 SMI1/KNR4 family protein [Myroides marinus]MDM1365818.1 SMI1/KNR4 family protein [Myroides marinus]